MGYFEGSGETDFSIENLLFIILAKATDEYLAGFPANLREIEFPQEL